jgi:LysM repeat protein
MGSLRQIGSGILLSVISIAIILGAFSLAMAQDGLIPAVAPTDLPATSLPTAFPTLPNLGAETPTGSAALTVSPTLTASPTASITPPPPSTTCPPPAGWLPKFIEPYDTLASIAQAYLTTVEALRSANCLVSDELVAGTFLYVPPQPTATRIPCGAPAGWINYTVKPGDTLYQIGLLYRVSVQQLQLANCLFTTSIRVGQVLKVPNVPVSTPWILTPTLFPTLTGEPSLIPTEESPSVTPETPAPTTEVPTLETPPTETQPPPTETTPTLQPEATPTT